MLLNPKGLRPRRTFLRSLRTVLKITAVHGVVPYSLRGHNLVIEAWQLSYNIFRTFILPFLAGCALIFQNPFLDRSFFSTFLFELQFIPYCFAIFSFLFCNISYRGDVASATSKLLKIERKFFLLNMEPMLRVSILKETVMPVLVICLSIVQLVSIGTIDFPSLAMFMTLQYSNFFLFIIENLIIFFLNVIQHFQCLLLHRIPCRESVLVKLCSIQDDLADITASIEKVYGIPVLCMVLSNLCFINVGVFFVAKMNFGLHVVINIGWIAIAFMLIFRISLLCEQMKEKREEFYEALYRLVKKDKKFKLLKNNYLRAHLLRKRNFSFNLAGFVEVDMNLVARVISATATFSVILIQMGKDF